MIVSGSTVASEALQGSALFDGFAEGDLLEFALQFARRVGGEKQPSRRIRDIRPAMPNHEAYFPFALNAVRAAAGRYPAPVACAEAVCAAFDRPFDAGLKLERELFGKLMLSSESAALRHVFQAERAASHLVDVPRDTVSRHIRKVGVVGAGTMGGGITMSLINAGLPVVLMETTQDALDRGIATMRRNYQGALKKSALTEAALEQRMALVTPTLDYGAFHDVDLVIEAVFENMEVKKHVFERLDAAAPAGAILASNTSALNLDEIAQFTERPQDVVGLHFFSPANLMRLVEVVRGARTAADVFVTAMRLAKLLGKAAVVAGVCDGYIGNRMVACYGAAAHDLVVAGASPKQLDDALESFGFAMGVFRVSDLAGLDIGRAAFRSGAPRRRPTGDPPTLPMICAMQGDWGRKPGPVGIAMMPVHERRVPIPPSPASSTIFAVNAASNRAR
jgi:3-hydroxyacyl-CoA dehydrogenase